MIPPLGLLWFDDSDKPLPEKIAEAAQRHYEKRGVRATKAFVNPAQCPPLPACARGIEIKASEYVEFDHVFVCAKQA